ncbi:hypothetical protein BJ165DRAFT_1535133 [Panaeolus papilionaceus]|nr:hypothetical protein BJ165DRAFT_1535133 [Panaeolus papilionaceus]
MAHSVPNSTLPNDCSVDQSLCEPFLLQSENDVTQLLSAAQTLQEQHLEEKQGIVQQLKVAVDALRQVEQRLATLDLQLGQLYYAIGASGYRIPVSIEPCPINYQVTQSFSDCFYVLLVLFNS